MYVTTLGALPIPSLPGDVPALIGKAKTPTQTISDIAAKIAWDGKTSKSYDVILKSAQEAAWAYIVEAHKKAQALVSIRRQAIPWLMTREECDSTVQKTVMAILSRNEQLIPPLTQEVLPMTAETAVAGGMGLFIIGGLALTAFVAYMLLKK